MGIEAVIKKEKDGQWRINQERVLSEEELEFERQRGL